MRLWPWSIALAAIAAGCGGGAGGNGNACTITAINVTANPGSVATGQTSTLTAVVNSAGSCSNAIAWSAVPAGGTLTPSGLTATFSSTTPATYTVTARSNDDSSRSASATVAVAQAAQCGTANGTVVTHSTNINASETWGGGGTVHSVPNTIAISAPATVTIQPCAIVVLGQNASINVRGDTTGTRTATLLAAGTDDTTGLVFFQRADAAKPWGVLLGINERSLIELHHAIVRGGGNMGGQYRNAAVVLLGPGYSSVPAGVLKVDHAVVVDPQGAGIYLDSNAAFSADSHDLGVVGATDHPLVMTMMAVGSIPTFEADSNARDDALVIGPNANVFANMTIHKRLPIRIRTASLQVAGPINDTTPVTLTIEPGVQLRFEPLTLQPGALVQFGGNGQSINKVGVLVALGTAADPIVFTSGAATPAPGDWKGLWLDTSPGSRLDHVIIEYAGGSNGISSANCRPTGTQDDAALTIGDFDIQYMPPANLITNSTIRYSAGFAIDAIWWNSTFAPDLTGQGNTFPNNTGCNQTLNTLTATPCTTHGCQPQ